MPAGLSHRERLKMILAGDNPDRFAASVWRHFYHRETTAENLAEAMIEFQNRFDWDFLKINPRASYHMEDWGLKLAWSTDEFEKHIKTGFPVKNLSDWDNIGVLKPTAPVLAEHLKAITLIKKAFPKDLPLFMTVFNPLGIARYLVGRADLLKDHLSLDEKRVMAALENITNTFELYAAEIRNAGADGLFYATLEWASSDMITYEQYARWCRPLDLRIIGAAGNDAINILHVCGGNNFVRELADYPVHMVNWDDAHQTNINLDDSFAILGDKTVAAGLDYTGWLLQASPEEIITEIGKIKKRMAGKRFIFAPGCAIDPKVPFDNLMAVKNSL